VSVAFPPKAFKLRIQEAAGFLACSASYLPIRLWQTVACSESILNELTVAGTASDLHRNSLFIPPSPTGHRFRANI